MRYTVLLIFTIGFFNYQMGNAQSTHLLEIGTIDSVYSDILKESREIYIQLPENYDPENSTKYPVIYILDGDVLLKAVETVYSFYYGGFLPDMILVGISNGEHRTRDLTTSKVTTRFGMPYTEENGEADNFIRFIEKELIPFMEKKYAASDYRTLIGHSYGGLFTINMLVNHADLFENYIAIDPSLEWDDQQLLTQSEEVFRHKNFVGKSLFLSLAGVLHMQKPEVTIDNVMEDTSDYTLSARSNILFSKLAQENSQNGLRSRWKFYEQDYHGTIPLPSIMDGLIYLFDWYQMENILKFNNPETPKEELFQIVKHREKKLRDHFGYAVPPYPQDLLEMLGYMNMQMKQPKKSLMFFQMNIEYYPDSANAYDSIADYFVEQKDYENALKYVAKAFELSGNDRHKERIKEMESKKSGG